MNQAQTKLAIESVLSCSRNVVRKSVCPMTRLAAIPLLNGGLNIKTRLFLHSPTHMFPDESKPKSTGALSPDRVRNTAAYEVDLSNDET